MAGSYAEDLAYIHHVGFGDFARKTGPWLVKTLRERGIAGSLIVEIGCGTGITSRELVSAGYSVLGVDNSAAMLKIARSFAPKVKFRRMSWTKFEIPSCEAVTAIGEVLGYRFDSQA